MGNRRAFSVARKAEVVNRRYKIKRGFGIYHRALKVEASANDLSSMLSSLTMKTLDQLQLSYRFLPEESYVSTAWDTRLWSPIVNKGDECVNQKDCEEGSVRYISSSRLIFGYMEEKDIVWTARRRGVLDCDQGVCPL